MITMLETADCLVGKKIELPDYCKTMKLVS